MAEEVTDPDLLKRLNGPEEVTDPALLKRLSGASEQPQSGLQRAGELLSQGVEGIKSGAAGMTDSNPYNYWYRKPLADVVGGIGSIVSAPSGLVSPYVERATGIPKEATEFALPFLVPGAKALGGRALSAASREVAPIAAAKAPESLADFAARMRAPKPPDTTPAAKLIDDIKYEASLRPKSQQEDALRDGIRSLLLDEKKRALFDADQIDKMEIIVRGTKTQNALRLLEDLVGKSALGEGVGRVAANVLGARPLGRKLTENQMRGLEDAIKRPKDAGSVGLGTVAPLEREVLERGRGGRPIRTAPLKIGSEDAILSAGEARAATAGIDRGPMRRRITNHAGGLPQAEMDQIIDLAMGAIKQYGTPEAAFNSVRIDNPVWDRAFRVALSAGYDTENLVPSRPLGIDKWSNQRALPSGKREGVMNKQSGLMKISDILDRVDDGWGRQGYLIKLPEGGTSGFISDRSEAISRARMTWPLAEDDLS